MSAVRRIPLDDAIKYLMQYNLQCDICGHSNWTIYVDPDNKTTVGSLNRIHENEEPSGGITMEFGGCTPVVQMQCKQCGQIKLFAANFIMQKVREGKCQ